MNDPRSSDLSLQSQDISLQPQAIVCPKCQHKRTAADHGPAWQCPSCGVAYNKAAASSAGVVHKVISTPGARGKQAIDRGEFETWTPGAIALSIKGRIGRLRYLAYGWPVVVFSYVLAIMAAIIIPQHKTPGLVLLVVLMALWFYMPLRLMALRMHDIGRSAKWVLLLLVLPAAAAPFGGVQLSALCSAFFWIVALILVFVPGSEDDNEYGVPAAENTTLVKVGAGLFLALMTVGTFANIAYYKYMRAHKLNPVLAAQQGAVAASGADAATESPLRVADFVGSWSGPDMTLQVDKSGDAVLYHLEHNFNFRAYGPLRVLDGNHVSIGVGTTPQVLKVTAPPHVVDGGATKMTLDGVELVRRD